MLAVPVSYRLIGSLAFAIASALVAFLVLGSYTRHVTLPGQLTPAGGVIAVYPLQHGTIVAKRVSEGDAVARGDVLFVISGERRSASLGDTHALIGDRLAARRKSLAAQIGETRLLEQAERSALKKRAAALTAELHRLDRAIADQTDRVELAEEAVMRYVEMHAEGFVSREHLESRREQRLDQRARLSSLERERAQLERQIAEITADLDNLAIRHRQQVAELERAIANVDLEATENEARRETAVVAPTDGIAAAVVGEIGRGVDTGTPLVSILPGGSRLRAELRAPSSAIGFIEPGADVRLRYPAYPYQKFGHHPGRVAAISRAALPGGEQGGPGHDPVYRVVVDLESESVDVYGRARALRAGMAVEADVRLETRRLYEWVLEPLYAIKMRAAGSGGT